MALANHLAAKGMFGDHPLFQFVLGVPWGAPATSETMALFKTLMPSGAQWAAFGIGRHEFPMLAQAVVEDHAVQLPDHLDLLLADLARRHLGQPVAYLVTETGNVNQYIHIWAYENAGDRERKRAAMWADPEWVIYTEESAKLGALVSQENRLMTPASFFPLTR
jgi:hypothetical protein